MLKVNSVQTAVVSSAVVTEVPVVTLVNASFPCSPAPVSRPVVLDPSQTSVAMAVMAMLKDNSAPTAKASFLAATEVTEATLSNPACSKITFVPMQKLAMKSSLFLSLFLCLLQ